MKKHKNRELLFCAELLYPCGNAVMLKQLTRALAGRGYRVSLAASFRKNMLPFIRSLTGVARWLPMNGSGKIEAGLRKLARRPPCAVVNFSSTDFGVEFAARLGSPLIWRATYHPAAFERSAAKVRLAVRQIAALADRVVAVSHFVRSAFTACGCRGISLIHEACDTAVFRPSPRERTAFRREFGLSSSDVAVGVVANLSRQKGQETLLRALTLLGSGGPRVHCFFAGGAFNPRMAAEKKRLQNLARRLPVNAKVHFIGYRRDALRVLNGLDILAFPSYKEGFGLSLLEAMSCEKPVIVSRSGAFEEIVSGKEAEMVPPGDPAALARSIRRIIREPELSRHKAKRARSRVRKMFSPRRQAGAYARLFREAAR